METIGKLRKTGPGLFVLTVVTIRFVSDVCKNKSKQSRDTSSNGSHPNELLDILLVGKTILVAKSTFTELSGQLTQDVNQVAFSCGLDWWFVFGFGALVLVEGDPPFHHQTTGLQITLLSKLTSCRHPLA